MKNFKYPHDILNFYINEYKNSINFYSFIEEIRRYEERIYVIFNELYNIVGFYDINIIIDNENQTIIKVKYKLKNENVYKYNVQIIPNECNIICEFEKQTHSYESMVKYMDILHNIKLVVDANKQEILESVNYLVIVQNNYTHINNNIHNYFSSDIFNLGLPLEEIARLTKLKFIELL